MIKNLLSALPLVLLAGPALAQSISGTVFEDVNYGGGAGRPLNTAQTSATNSGYTGSLGRPGVIVEAYRTSTGAFVTSAVTNAAGLYTLTGFAANTAYTVRVVNSSVTSGRTGATYGGTATAGYYSNQVAVQTFRTNSGAADVNRVGGEYPAGTDAASNVAGGSNVALVFQGLNSSGDNTMYVDNVQVLQGGTALTTNPIQNPGFESGVLVPTGGSQYQYNPTPATTFGWTFSSASGIQANGSAFGSPLTTDGTGAEGTRASFIQNGGSISQTFSLAAGTYSIRFAAANRAYGGAQSVNVTINGTTVLANVTASTSGYAVYTTNTFTVSAGGANFSTISATAQSVSAVTTGAALSTTTGVNFGYSFDLVTNTNDAGQGSIRQFITNANALGNANITQAGNYLNAAGTSTAMAAGVESSIFMIPNGANPAPAGLRTGLASGLNGGSGANTWALLNLASTLPALTDASTALDATTQTVNVSDSNPGQVGLGGASGRFPTVGTQALTYSTFNRPEVEMYVLSSLANLVSLQANNSTLRGFALHGGGSTGTVQVSGATGVLLESNLIGVTALSIDDPTLTTANSAGNYCVNLSGTLLGVTVNRNVIAYANNSGIYIPSGATQSGSSITIQGNELVQNGYRVTGGDNITLGDQGATGPVTISANLIRTANSDGLQFDIGGVGQGGVGYNTVENNTFFDNGNGGASVARAQLEGAAILYLQRSASINIGTNPDVIRYNIINQTQAGAIVVGYGQSRINISQNSTFFNGTPFNSPTAGNLGIDLITQASYYVQSSNAVGARDYGNGDGVTPNTGTVASPLANQGMNYPIFTVATATGQTSNLVNVAGYVGSAPGQTQFANARVEIFTADNVPANNNGNIVSGDGQTQAHGEGRTYITTLTCDANGNFSGQITVPANSPPLSGTAVTGFLTATAYLSAYGTSEFGPNRPIIVSADVQAVIVGSGATAAGQTGQFVATFSNPTFTGPVQADGVIATVQMRPGLTNVNVAVSVQGAGQSTGTYDPATGLVSFNLPPGGISLASGYSATATITYTQPASGPVTATAAITTTTNEAGQTANNTSTATNPTTLGYDVTTAITGPATATAGNQVAYVVTTTNLQNTGAGYISPASNVTQSVTVPAGATNVYVTGNGVITGSSGAGYTVTWPTLPSLNNGQSVSQTVSFTAPTANYSLTATVGSTPTDAASGNNTTTFNTTTSASSGNQANVFARISASSATVAPGATGTFTVVQGNAGPYPAANARSLVVLPPNLTGVVVTGSSGTIAGAYNATTGLVTLPTTASQASGTTNNLTYTISFTAPATGGVVPATAQVLTTSPDQVPANNEASALITVAAAADVVVQVTGPTIGTVGQPLTYTVTTSNNGPGSALNITQTANLPAGLPITGTSALLLNGSAPTSVSGSTATYGSGTTAFTYNQTNGLVTFPTTASLATSVSLQNTFTLLTPPNGNLPITVSSAAVASSPDSNTANNGSSLTTNVTPTTDVQVTLNSAGQVSPGNRLTYGVTTFNNGPATAPGVATTVSLPTGLTTVTINGQTGTLSGGVYTYADGSTYDPRTTGSTPGIVTLPALTNLAPGNASGVANTISYILPSGFQGTLTSTATATVTGIADFIPSNNTAIIQPFIVASSGTSDLQVTLTASAGTVAAGSPLTLNYTASTAAAVTGLLQSVLLPAGLTSGGGTVTVTDGNGVVGVNYDNQSGLLTLPPYLNVTGGGSVSYQIALSQVSGTGPLVATATINSTELDSNPANNIARLTVNITPAATLQATVSGPASVIAGSTVSYLISALNTGRTPTTGATQTVNVPTGATNLVLNGNAITYPAGGVLSLPTPSTLLPGTGNTVVNTLSFTAPGAAGTSFTVPTTLAATGPGTVGNATANQPTVITNPGPVAQNVVNVALSATGTQVPFANNVASPQSLQPLVAAAQGTASLASYTVQALPLASQGVLYLWNGTTNTAVTAGQTLTSAQASQLRFQPAAGYSGNATFLYSATDNAGAVSNVAQYLIPVGPDLNSAYTGTPAKGGSNAYANDDVLAYVIDPNGALYTSGSPGLVYGTTGGTRSTLLQSGAANGLPTSGTNAVLAASGSGPTANGSYPANTANTLPAGTALDPATGFIYVSNRTLLPKVTTTTYYQVNVITTDVYGGLNTATAQFVLGAYPLPVELVAFTAQAVQNRDALLKWTTASEANNDHFEVERSLDGTSYAQIGQVRGQGSKASATDYTLTDAGIAAKVAAGQPVYYRLRQVDVDGTSTYSPVRTLSFSGAPALSLTPNPAATTPTLTLTQAPAGTYTATLLDALGRTVRTLALTPGQPQLLPVQGMASGTYLVVVTGEAGLRLTQRLLLQP